MLFWNCQASRLVEMVEKVWKNGGVVAGLKIKIAIELSEMTIHKFKLANVGNTQYLLILKLMVYFLTVKFYNLITTKK